MENSGQRPLPVSLVKSATNNELLAHGLEQTEEKNGRGSITVKIKQQTS